MSLITFLPLFLGSSLHSGLGDFSTRFVSLYDTRIKSAGNMMRWDGGYSRFDDSYCDGLSHVTDSETSKRRVVSEGLNTHWLRRYHLDDSSVTRLDELGGVLNGLSGAAIDLLKELGEFASNMGRVAIKDWRVPGTDLARVVEDDDLSVEGLGTFRRVVLGVTSNIATTNFLDRNVLDVESNVVTGKTLNKLFVVHLNGFDFGSDIGRSEGHDHTGFDDASLNTSDGHRPNTTDLVNVLERQTESFVCRAGRRVDGVNSLKKGLASCLGLGLLLPALVPWAVGGVIDHVIAIEARDGDERNRLGVVSDLLDEVGCLLDDFVVTILRPFRGVHLVDGDDELLHPQGVGEQCVLTSLAILGNTSLELTSSGSNDKNGAVGLGCSGDHVLDEITMTRSIWKELDHQQLISGDQTYQ